LNTKTTQGKVFDPGKDRVNEYIQNVGKKNNGKEKREERKAEFTQKGREFDGFLGVGTGQKKKRIAKINQKKARESKTWGLNTVLAETFLKGRFWRKMA